MLKTKFIIVCLVLIVSGLAQFLGCGKDNNESPPQNTENPVISNPMINPSFAYVGSGTPISSGYIEQTVTVGFDYYDPQGDIVKVVVIKKAPVSGGDKKVYGTSTIYGSKSGAYRLKESMNTYVTTPYSVHYTLTMYLIDEIGHISNSVSIDWPILYP